MKALLLQRTSQQGKIELPPESTKLNSEPDFWRHFMFHVMQGGRQSRIFSCTYLHFFVLRDETLEITGGVVTIPKKTPARETCLKNSPMSGDT